METIYLSGSEDVRRAGSNISSAADTMQGAANTMDAAAYIMKEAANSIMEALYAHGEKLAELTAALNRVNTPSLEQKDLPSIYDCPSCVEGKCVSGPHCKVPF